MQSHNNDLFHQEKSNILKNIHKYLIRNNQYGSNGYYYYILYKKINSTSNFEHLLQISIELERHIYYVISNIVKTSSHFQINREELDQTKPYIKFLFQLNHSLKRLLLQMPSIEFPNLYGISNRIVIPEMNREDTFRKYAISMDGDKDIKFNDWQLYFNRTLRYLEDCRGFVLLALAKVSFSDLGREFIAELYEQLCPYFNINIHCQFDGWQYGLFAISLGEIMTLASSNLCFRINYSNVPLREQTAERLIGPLNKGLGQCLWGSFSFTHNQVPYYTPVDLEIIHELVHVLHNAQGLNDIYFPNTDEFDQGDQKGLLQDKWTNWEEYRTIKLGKFCENAFNKLYNLPERADHRGFPYPRDFFNDM